MSWKLTRLTRAPATKPSAQPHILKNPNAAVPAATVQSVPASVPRTNRSRSCMGSGFRVHGSGFIDKMGSQSTVDGSRTDAGHPNAPLDHHPHRPSPSRLGPVHDCDELFAKKPLGAPHPFLLPSGEKVESRGLRGWDSSRNGIQESGRFATRFTGVARLLRCARNDSLGMLSDVASDIVGAREKRLKLAR